MTRELVDIRVFITRENGAIKLRRAEAHAPNEDWISSPQALSWIRNGSPQRLEVEEGYLLHLVQSILGGTAVGSTAVTVRFITVTLDPGGGEVDGEIICFTAPRFAGP